MPKTYPDDFRLRAVALANVRSIPVAARQLGVDRDTLTRWVGEQPQTAALEQAVNLALSELMTKMASGEMSPRDLTVGYGVLRDKQARYGKTDAAEPPTDAESWGARIEAALVKHFGSDADLALMAAIEWLGSLPGGDAPSIPAALVGMTT